jgi:putative oxidoreductase
MVRWLTGLQPFGALCMRLVLGVAMFVHGWAKVAPLGGLHSHDLFSGINHFAHYVTTLGLPHWLGYVSALTEFLGGILLVVGLLTRFAAFMVAGNMLVALLFVNIHQGYHGSEYTLALLALALMILFHGAGSAALDRKLHLA